MSRKRCRMSEEELPKQEYDSDANEPEVAAVELTDFDPETSQPDPLEATNRKRSARRSTAEIAQQAGGFVINATKNIKLFNQKIKIFSFSYWKHEESEWNFEKSEL